MSFFLTSMYVCPIYLPLSSYQWRWPKQWPFPADYLEVVSVAADTVTPLTEVPQDAFRAFINSKITAGQSVLELGDSSISFCQIGSCKTFDIKQASAGPLPFEENTFDVVVISAGLESLLDARGVYRNIWKILKPGGLSVACFSGMSYSPVDQTMKMWTTMNDEQKIWIAGSYYQYSAGDGWDNVEGYDLLGSTGTGSMVFDGDKLKNVEGAAYTVVANKIKISPPGSPDFSAYNFSRGTLAGLSADIDEEDREFCSLRIATEYERKGSEAERAHLLSSVSKLPSIYDILKEVKNLVIPNAVKAMLAVFVVEQWNNTDEQREAMKKGLGIEKPDDYWTALGSVTSAMPPREKILFLADVIPQVGTNVNIPQLPAFFQELSPRIRAKLPELDEANLQIFVADVAITDFCIAAQSGDRIVRYIDSLAPEVLKKQIDERMAVMLK